MWGCNTTKEEQRKNWSSRQRRPTLYGEQGKYEQAESLYLRAMHIRETQLGPKHYLVASLLNNLAGVYFDQGRYTQAEPLYLRALHI